MSIEIKVNGKISVVDADPSTPLLYLLRNDLGLNGPRYGCGLGQCGACVVLVDGAPVRSCVTPASGVAGAEALAPHPVQAAFIAEQAAQCGYCTNGMILSAVALLDRVPKPSNQEIREALDSCLCRCGTHTRILEAVRRASAAAE